MFSSPLLLQRFTRLTKHAPTKANGIVFRPLSMAFWLCAGLLAFVCAMPFLPIAGTSTTPGLIWMVQDASP
jgi:hypothetical protein